MFFKKKKQVESRSESGPEPSPESGEGALSVALGTAEDLKARVVGLECSLGASLRNLLGERGFQSRVGSVTIGEGQPPRVKIEFVSDGLGLQGKSEVEAFVTSEMDKRYPGAAKWVVFMRSESGVPQKRESQRSRGQAPEAPKSSPQAAPAPKMAGTRRAIPGVKSIIAVASGKGGVGKSTVSVNLAVSLHNQGLKVGLLDADIYGPSLPLMMGIKDEPHVNAANKIVPPKRDGIPVMSFGYFAGEDAAVIWRGPMIMKALQQFFYDVDWGELDALVIDLPPGTGDAQLTLVQSLPVDGAVIVTTPQNVALLDAVKGIVMFNKTEVPVIGVVENMSGYLCPSCGVESHVFGQGGGESVSKRYDVPLLGQIPLNTTLREAGDDGDPVCFQDGHPLRVRFAEVAGRVTERLAALETAGAATPKASPLVAARQREKESSVDG